MADTVTSDAKYCLSLRKSAVHTHKRYERTFSSYRSRTGVFPLGFSLFVPPDYRAQGHRFPHGGLRSHGPLRAARHAPGQQCFARVVRQGDERLNVRLGTGGGLSRRCDRFRLCSDGPHQDQTIPLRTPAQSKTSSFPPRRLV